MSDNQLAKLSKKIDEGFAEVNKKLVNHDKSFERFFTYTESFRKEVNENFEQTAKQDALERLTNTVDAFIKRLDDNDVELAARDAQFERLLDWARKVSKKTGIPLENL